MRSSISASVCASSAATSASVAQSSPTLSAETAQTAQRFWVRIRSGCKGLEQLAVDHVQGPSIADRLAHALVDLEAGKARRVDARGGHDREVVDLSGQSHSSETPTSDATKPRSATISVALGRSEQIRIGRVLLSAHKNRDVCGEGGPGGRRRPNRASSEG
jgi:hypothetical protein